MMLVPVIIASVVVVAIAVGVGVYFIVSTPPPPTDPTTNVVCNSVPKSRVVGPGEFPTPDAPTCVDPAATQACYDAAYNNDGTWNARALCMCSAQCHGTTFGHEKKPSTEDAGEDEMKPSTASLSGASAGCSDIPPGTLVGHGVFPTPNNETCTNPTFIQDCYDSARDSTTGLWDAKKLCSCASMCQGVTFGHEFTPAAMTESEIDGID